MSALDLCEIRRVACLLLCAALVGPASMAGGKLPGRELMAVDAVQPQAQNVEFVGQIGGWITTVVVQGSYAYVGVGSRIEVLDVSNPGAPVKLSSYQGPRRRVTDIQLVGHYAYVAFDCGVDHGSLRLLDISDPAAPVEVGAYDTPQAILGLYVAGHHAYLAAGTAGLRIVDISNPAVPLEVGLYDVPRPARDVYIVGNYAYVAHGEAICYGGGAFCDAYGGLDIVDISDPSAPKQVGTYYPGLVDHVQLSGTYAYITSQTFDKNRPIYRLRIVDVSDPTAPVEVAAYRTPGTLYNVCVDQNHAYVAAGSAGLRVLDVSNPAQPVEISAWQTVADVSYACTVGSHAFVLADGLGLLVLDVSNPSAPLRVGAYEMPDYVGAVEVVGRYAYVGGLYHGLRVLDISNPAAPLQVGSIYDDPPIDDIQVVGNYAYLAADWDGLYIVDISDPTAPREVGKQARLLNADKVDVSGRYAYVVNWFFDRLHVVDVSNPTAPRQVGDYAPTTGTVAGVDVVGRYAYVAAGVDGLRVVDVSDPTRPTEAGALGGLGYVEDVYVVGNYAYLNADGLQVVDVSNPTSPVPVGALTQRGSVGLCVAGRYAYVFDEQYDPDTYLDQGKLVVLDLSNPAAPAEVGFFHTEVAPTFEDMCCAGPYVYVGDSNNGLMIFRFAPSASASVPPTGGSLISPADHTTYTFAPATFTSTVVVTHATPASVPPTSGLVSIGHTGFVAATFSSSGQPAEPGQPYTLAVQYSEAERGPAIESCLALYHWQGTRWVREPSSAVDAVNNTVTARTTRLGLWAILGDTWRVFLPMVSMKN